MKAIFLDRDGVLNKPLIKNRKSFAPRLFSEFKLYPNIAKDCSELKKKGYLLIVVTNQPDVDKGLLKISELKKMNSFLKKKIDYDKMYISYSSSNKSFYKKPNPGMLKKAQKKFNLNISNCYLIGDRWRDIEAAENINCKAVFIDRNYKEKKPTYQIISVKSFSSAVKYITRSKYNEKKN